MKKILIVGLVLSFNANAFATCIVDNTTCFRCSDSCTVEFTYTSIQQDDGKQKTVGTVTVSGTGEMENYEYGASPWRHLLADVHHIVIDNGITSVGAFAFQDMENVGSVDIAESVLSIGEGAFWNLNQLKSLNIPNSVTEIKNAAFAHLDSLEDVKLSNSLISMGDSAFWDAKNLHELIIPDTLETSGDSAFWGFNKDAKIYCKETKAHRCIDIVNDVTRGNKNLIVYAKDGDYYIVDGKKYKSWDNLRQDIPVKRIYTIDEANRVAGEKNRVSIRYR